MKKIIFVILSILLLSINIVCYAQENINSIFSKEINDNPDILDFINKPTKSSQNTFKTSQKAP